MLRKLCNAFGILPTSHTLPEGLEILSERPNMSGGFSDVLIGTYKGQKVAVKALRAYTNDDLSKIKKVSAI